MRGVIYLLFACVLVGCGNSSRSNQDADYSDSAMAIPEVVDTFSAPIQENTSTPPAENAANHGAPADIPKLLDGLVAFINNKLGDDLSMDE